MAALVYVSSARLPMRILVEILHPAHVHFFRNAIAEWLSRGDQVLVLSRDKDVANQLLEAYGITYRSISKLGSSKLSLIGEMLVRDARMLGAALKFKPDILVGIMGVTIVQVAQVIRRPAVVFYDTENAKLTNSFVYPLAHSVCTPECYQGRVRGTHVRYPSYHELAYLHPSRFTPDERVVRAAGIRPDEKFFLLRFVSWQASHDLGEVGFDLKLKKKLVEQLSERGRVLISSESELPEELEVYRFSAPPEQVHHFVAFASLLFGVSATMASEAAVLGTPAFYVADTGRGYTDEEEQIYQLVYNYKLTQAEEAVAQAIALLDQPNLTELTQERHQRLLAERIDATSWMIDYIDQVLAPA